MEAKDQTDFITRSEVMKLLQVSGVTLSRYTKSGRLTFYRVGRRLFFDRNELLTEIKTQKII